MLYLLVFWFGLAVGSFVNVLIYRLPRQRGLGGRSACPHCAQTIRWYDLFPLASWLMLRGRCRHCRQAISWQYFAVELYSGLIALVSFRWGSEANLSTIVFIFLLSEIFLALFIIDLKHLILPDGLLISGLLAALNYGLLSKQTYQIFSYQNLLAALVVFAFFFLFWLISRGNGLGLGDAKLAGLIGLIFGPLGGAIIIYLAIALGALIGLAMLLFGRANLKTKLPLGSFLCLTASVYLFFGYAIIQRADFLNLIWRINK